MVLPKFPVPTKPTYQSVDEVCSKGDLSRSNLMDDSGVCSAENRDESMQDIFSATGTQFSVATADADARQGTGEKELVSPNSPVDCYGFPGNGGSTDQWQKHSADVSQPNTNDTVEESKDTIDFNTKEFVEWQLSNPPPPPPPPTKPPIPTLSPSPIRVKHILDNHRPNKSVNQTEATELTSFDTPSQSFAAEGSTFFVGTPFRTKDYGNDDSFFESAGNATMDAFGFPIAEPPTLPPPRSASPAVSVKSVKAVPTCPRDSPTQGMRPAKSDPALNRLIYHAQRQAHYREPSPVEFDPKTDAERAASPTESTERKLDCAMKLLAKIEAATSAIDSRDEAESIDRQSQVGSKSPHGSTSPIELKLKNAKELLNKAKEIVTDEDVDKMLDQIEDPNKSTCESGALEGAASTTDDNTNFGVTSTDDTNPVMNISTSFLPRVARTGSPPSIMEGSFDVQESSIELLDSSYDIPTRIAKTARNEKRTKPSKFDCSGDNLYCNINLADVEKAMWELMDILDENAGKCGYVVGCIDRIPKVVNTSVNDTFSLLEDESLLNRMAAQHSVSVLDSLTVDD